MRKPSKVEVINYVEADYGMSRPKMRPCQRGDERVVQCDFSQGKSEITVNIAENDAAHTEYSLYLLFPGEQHNREADLYLTRRQLLALPSILQAAIREADKIKMFDRGPSLWARREIDRAPEA